jgi:glyoxylase I family protein
MNMGIPGIRGTDHVGFTVPDIEAATKFFVEVIGCDYIYKLGPFASDDDWMARQLNVDPRTIIRENRHFRLGQGANFEIFQYEPADGDQGEQPKNSDLGGHHLAFYVDDLDIAIEHLKKNNVRVLGEPVESKAFAKGQRWIYFLSPWGMQMELVSYPNGKEYEATAPVKLWSPKSPAE